MYMHIYACICTVYVRIIVNTAAKRPEILQCKTRLWEHTRTLLENSETLFIAHFSVSIYLVVDWTNRGPLTGVDVEQGASSFPSLIQKFGSNLSSAGPQFSTSARTSSWMQPRDTGKRPLYKDIHTYTYVYMHIQYTCNTYKYIHFILRNFFCPWHDIHAYTYQYIHIHTYTFIYLQIHSNQSQFTWAANTFKSVPVHLGRVAGPWPGDGDKRPMHPVSFPADSSSLESSLLSLSAAVRPGFKFGRRWTRASHWQSASHGSLGPPGHGDGLDGAAGYDALSLAVPRCQALLIQVHSVESQPGPLAVTVRFQVHPGHGNGQGWISLGTMYSVPGGLKFTRWCRQPGTQCPGGRATGGRFLFWELAKSSARYGRSSLPRCSLFDMQNMRWEYMKVTSFPADAVGIHASNIKTNKNSCVLKWSTKQEICVGAWRESNPRRPSHKTGPRFRLAN